MKLLTRNTDYGIRALCFIAKAKDKIVPVPELVKALRIPKPFLRKILQLLTKNGFVKSYKGMGGGFSLAIPASLPRLTAPAKYSMISSIKDIYRGFFCIDRGFPCICITATPAL